MPTELREGMLLLEPPRYIKKTDFTTPANIWTVAKVNKKSARIIRADETSQVNATTRSIEVPKGWSVINNRALAIKLNAHREAHTFPVPD